MHVLGQAGAVRFNTLTLGATATTGAIGAAWLLIHFDGIESSMLTNEDGKADNNRDLNDEEGRLSPQRMAVSLGIKTGQVATNAGIQELMRAVIATNGKASGCAASLVGFLFLRNLVNIKTQDVRMACLQREQ